MKKGLWMNNEPIDLFSSELASHAPPNMHTHTCTHRTGMPRRRMAGILPRLNVEAEQAILDPLGELGLCVAPASRL